MKKKSKYNKDYFRNIQSVNHDLFFACDHIFGYSFKQLSDRSGLSESCIRNLYNGNTRFPRYDTMYLISKALGFTLGIEEGKKLLKLRQVQIPQEA